MPTIALADVSLYYEATGAGEPVVFLHGLGCTVRDWEPQVRHFSATHRVFAVDACGHGRSSKPPGPYSIAQFGRQMADFVRQVVGGPAHVVGLSMGGAIAFQMAVDHPDVIRTLTIVNSGPEVVPRTFAERRGLWMRVFIVRWFGLAKMGQILAPRLFPNPDQEPLRRAFLEQLLANDRDAYLASLRALIGWSVTARIGSITAPTLVVAAELDYTPVSRKEEYVRLMRHAQLVVVPGAHHGLPMEDPATFNQVLGDFLSAHSVAPVASRGRS